VPTLPTQYREILQEELNVKQVEFGGKSVALNTELTDELRAEGAMRDVVRHVQNLRKTAGLNVDDRIVLRIQSADALVQAAVSDFGDVIKQETLATELTDEAQEHTVTAKVEGVEVLLSLSKVE
jgi:isoleucyl-tRNA synthetase